jgi:hypothetical protein
MFDVTAEGLKAQTAGRTMVGRTAYDLAHEVGVSAAFAKLVRDGDSVEVLAATAYTLLPDAYLADTARQAIEMFDQMLPDTVFLDYDLHHFTSEDFARHLVDVRFAGKVFVHSTNRFGIAVLERIIPGASIAPFGTFEVRRVREGSDESRTRVSS